MIDLELCDLCGTCASVCPKNCIDVFNSFARIRKDECSGCGRCVYACPVRAIRIDKREVAQA
jgi:MinD superfamily P-loop ATPase